jgi:methylphosphotriester-DNA--protein-cysteine methyltransferase
MRLPVLLVRYALCLIAAALFASDVAAQRPVRREDAQFIASSRGQVYCSVRCDSWKRLSPQICDLFRAAAEAEAAGYRTIDRARVRAAPEYRADQTGDRRPSRLCRLANHRRRHVRLSGWQSHPAVARGYRRAEAEL